MRSARRQADRRLGPALAASVAGLSSSAAAMRSISSSVSARMRAQSVRSASSAFLGMVFGMFPGHGYALFPSARGAHPAPPVAARGQRAPSADGASSPLPGRLRRLDLSPSGRGVPMPPRRRLTDASSPGRLRRLDLSLRERWFKPPRPACSAGSRSGRRRRPGRRASRCRRARRTRPRRSCAGCGA